MSHTLRIVTVASSAGLLLMGCGPAATTASPVPSPSQDPGAACGPFEKQLAFAPTFTPYEARRSATAPPGELLSAQLRPTDADDREIPRVARGRAVAEAVRGTTSTYAFGAKAVQELARSGSLSAFYRSGGVLADQAPAADSENYASVALSEEGDRARAVRIGDTEGTVVWADPIDESGVRPYVVLWRGAAGDDQRVIAEGLGQAVSAARDLECGDS